ncbi:MAG TPA: archease [Gaiellaceae bacterium]|nr:archease [Gaiellaceae bacterium]
MGHPEDVKAYRFAEHGGEVELELEAPTAAGIFEAAVAALAELVSAGADGEPARRELELRGEDPALLLVDTLNELVYLGEVEGFVPERLEAVELAGGRLRATVAGRRGRARPLVKAVTLNSLELAQEEGSWHGRVVLDV